ncbi:hypothetical protein ACROYT_G036583 [Oculina patagonica]
MLVIEDLELYDTAGYGSIQTPPGFTTLMIDNTWWNRTALAWQQWQLTLPGAVMSTVQPGALVQQQVNAGVLLNVTHVREDFARLVLEAITARGYGSCVTVEIQGPAVTLKITDCRNGRVVSVDLTLAFKFKFWPQHAEEWKRRYRCGWPNPFLVENICNDGYHVVAVHPKGHNWLPGRDFLWRYSFSAAEKKLFQSEPSHNSCCKQLSKIAFSDCQYSSLAEERSSASCPGKVRGLHNISTELRIVRMLDGKLMGEQ